MQLKTGDSLAEFTIEQVADCPNSGNVRRWFWPLRDVRMIVPGNFPLFLISK